MKVSIITPAFNPGKLILETFISLQNQTFKDFEWIIIDDCSNEMNTALFQQIKTDASFSVIVISNPINFRQARSKNIGLQHAKGKYIKFLDADDLLDIDHLENQYNAIQELTYDKFAIFSPTLNFWQRGDKREELLNKSYKKVNNNNFDQLKQFIVFPFFSHCGCLFLKQDIIDINGFDDSLITDEDGDLIIRLMLNGLLFIAQEDSVYIYRHHTQKRVSVNDSNDKWKSRMNVCKKMEAHFINKFSPLKEQLSQRLDLLAIEAYRLNNPIYIDFLEKAEQLYPNYKFPGNKLQNFIRKFFGFKFMILIKYIIKS